MNRTVVAPERAAPLFDLVAAGSHGDVHPFLAIGRALLARGARVRLFSHPHFAPAAQAAGVPLLPIGADDYEQVVTDPRLFHPRKGGAYVLEMVLRGLPLMEAALRSAWAVERPVAVLGHPVCVGVRWICAGAGIPLALAQLAPQTLLTRGDPVAPFQLAPGALARGVARLAHGLVLGVVNRYVGKRLAPLRRARGLEPEARPFERELLGAPLLLAMWSPAFRGPVAGDPPGVRICGFPWWDRKESEPATPGLEEFLADGSPPLCFSLGSAAAWQPGDFYRHAIAACGALGVRGLLITRDLRGLPSTLPRGLFAASYVPFSTVLPRVGAFIHHGGIGTTAQGLRAGVRSLVVAHAHDQFNNGARVALLGAGRTIARGQLSPRRLARELGTLLADAVAARRAQELAQALQGEEGAATAARELLEFAGVASVAGVATVAGSGSARVSARG